MPPNKGGTIEYLSRYDRAYIDAKIANMTSEQRKAYANGEAEMVGALQELDKNIGPKSKRYYGHGERSDTYFLIEWGQYVLAAVAEVEEHERGYQDFEAHR